MTMPNPVEAPGSAENNRINVPIAEASSHSGPDMAFLFGSTATGTKNASRDVLLVDDIEMNRDILSAFLLSAGYSVQVAGSGLEAIRMATGQRFDVIIMDVCMPEMDGLEATRRIRALSSPCSQVPVLALTSYGFEAQVIECRLAGMSGHLQKPVDQQKLISTVELAIAGALHNSSWESSVEPATEKSLEKSTAVKQKSVCLDRTMLTSAIARLSVDEVQDALQELDIRGKQIVRLMHQAPNWTLLADTALVLAPVAGTFGFVALSAAARRFGEAVNNTPLQPQLGEALRGETCAALAQLSALSHESCMEPFFGFRNRAKGIIVVEDDPVSRSVICAVMRNAKQQVYLAADGLEAFILAKTFTPILILLDVAMPLLNGLLACEAIRALPDCANLPIVLLTGYDDRPMQGAAQRVGATDMVTKPFRPVELMARLAGYIDLPGYIGNSGAEDVVRLELTTDPMLDQDDSLRGGWVKAKDGDWDGPQAPVKDLQHRLADVYLYGGIPLDLVQKWLGYAPLSTNTIGADTFISTMGEALQCETSWGFRTKFEFLASDRE